MRRRHATLKVGAVYAIKMANGRHSFGQVAIGGDMAFFDFQSTEVPTLERIVENRVAFRVPVALDAPKEGGWELLGALEPRGALAEYAKYRYQPVGSPRIFIYRAGETNESTLEGVAGLEVLATWFSSHIEQRLDDHFSGRRNKVVDSLLIR